MKSPRENPAKQHVVLRPAPFDTETEGEEKVHVYLTHARVKSQRPRWAGLLPCFPHRNNTERFVFTD